jgi:hypothetical protein
VLLAFTTLLAGCGDPSDTTNRPTIDASGKATTTTRPAASTVPDTTATATTQAPSTTTTAPPPPTTTTTAAPNSLDPVLVTGTFTPAGTLVSTDLPEGAIGPAEYVVSRDPMTLGERIGVGTYRLHADILVGYGEPDVAIRYVVEVDAVEGSDPTEHSSHERWFAPAQDGDGGGPPVFGAEVITIGDRRFAREVDEDEWTEVGFPMDIAGPIVIAPTRYATLDALSDLVSAWGWLGNEDVDGIPVGHYEVPPYPDLQPDSYDGPEFASQSEFWVDADNVVWQWISSSTVDGNLWQSMDLVLFDVGANITIAAPIP